MRNVFKLFLILILSLYISGANWLFRPVGIEFEYAASPNVKFKPVSEGYINLLDIVKSEFPGGVTQLKDWNRYQDALGTQYGFFIDESGRSWKAVPEIMSDDGAFDGFELVTPPLTSTIELEKLSRLLVKIKNSGVFVTGKYSSTHYTSDVSDLNEAIDQDKISDDDNIAKFVDLILFIENHIIEIYHMIQPQRYGTVMNEFAVPLSFNQRDLLHELASLPKAHRTRKNVRALFIKHQGHEFNLSRQLNENLWKLRAFNYAKFLELGDFSLALILEMRLSDLVDPDRLILIERLFKAIIETGIAEETYEFSNPFGAISPSANFVEVSEYIKKSLDKSRYLDLLKKLDFHLSVFPPFHSADSMSHDDTSFNSCDFYLLEFN